MPVYEYVCDYCSYRFDLKQSFYDKAEAKCPRCKNNARRIFSPTSIIFKGSGFYITDSRAENERHLGKRRDGEKPEKTEGPKESAKEEKVASSDSVQNTKPI